MVPFEITIPDEKIQHLLRGDRGMAALLEPMSLKGFQLACLRQWKARALLLSGGF